MRFHSYRVMEKADNTFRYSVNGTQAVLTSNDQCHHVVITLEKILTYVSRVYSYLLIDVVKDWGESVSEIMIVKKKKPNYKKLYTVLFCLGVFTFCTSGIVTCLGWFVASFKLSCV